jgi:spore maturation protein CgeB
VKPTLLSLPGIPRLHAALRAFQTKARYWRTVRHYAARVSCAVRTESLARIARLAARHRAGNLRIFFIGTDEQQDKSGCVQALDRIADLRCFTRADGAWGQNDLRPYQARRAANTARAVALLDTWASEGWVPDLILMQSWGSLIDAARLAERADDTGTCLVNIAMDDRHQYWGRKVDGNWDGTFGLIPHVDLHLTAAPEAVAWYRKEGALGLFFPEASDPAIFRPRPDLPKCHDICFVGGRYGIRERMVQALRASGLSVSAFGLGWEAGRLATEEVPVLFAQSRIILGIGTIGHCTDFHALKLRDFDATMSGSCYLTSANEDLSLLFRPQEELVTYTSISDCVEQARRLLAEEARREGIAAAGLARARLDHTWDRRFADMFAALDDLAGSPR